MALNITWMESEFATLEATFSIQGFELLVKMGATV